MIKHPHALEQQTHAAPEMGSDRSFGLVFAVVFTFPGLLPVWNGGDVRWWALAVALGFLVVALARPRLLHPLNLLWFRLGMAMHKVVTPLVMGLMFFVVITPISIVMRGLGKDPLRLKKDGAASYWILRESQGPAPESMKNQF